MTKALISIDYTVDFVADDGKLTAGAPAQAISKTIAQVTKTAFDRGDYIFFAIDAHDEGDIFHLISIRSIKQILAFFGWTNDIILLFQEQIWIFACEKEK